MGRRENEVTIDHEVYKIEGKFNKFLEIKREEVKALYELYKYEMVSSSLLHQLWKTYVNSEFHRTSISNRIRKFVDFNMLIREQEDFMFNQQIQSSYYYRIGPKGYDLLDYVGLIDIYDWSEITRRNRRLKIPTANALALSDVIQNVVVKNDDPITYIMHSKFQNNWIASYPWTEEEKELLSFFETAWVLEGSKQYVLVIGHYPFELLSKIEKIFRVIYQFSKELVRDERRFFIIFGWKEKRSREEGGSETQRRHNIQQLKNAIPFCRDWHPNLDVFVVPYERLEEKIQSIFDNSYANVELFSSMEDKLNAHLERLTTDNEGNYDLHYQLVGEEKLRLFHLVYQISYKGQQHHLIAVPGEEGSIKTFQIINLVYIQMLNPKSFEYEKNPCLVVFYTDENQEVQDFLPSYFRKWGQKISFEKLNFIKLLEKSTGVY